MATMNKNNLSQCFKTDLKSCQPVLLKMVPCFPFHSYSLSLCLADGHSKISSVYINNTHGVDDDDFYDRNLALFEV